MKVKSLIAIFSFLFLFFFPIPDYVELNQLILIESIEITCKDNEYFVVLKEILPKKEDNAIIYEYKEYQGKVKDIKDIKKKMEENYSYKFYYNKAHRKVINCSKIKRK